MRRIGLLGAYEWGLLAVLVLIVLHAPLSVAVGTAWPDFALLAKVWKEIILGMLTVTAMVLVTKRHMWRAVTRRPVVGVCLGFIGLHMLLALLLGGDLRAVAAGLLIDVRFVAMFLLAYVLVLLRPESLRRMLVAVAAGAVVVLGFGLLQITVLPDDVLKPLGYSKQTITPYTTIDSNPDYVRINSTLRGPNPLGALAVVYAALALAYLMRRYARASVRSKATVVAVVAASIAVLFASYSRSAYLALVLALAVLAGASLRLSRKIVSFATAGLLIGAVTLAGVSTTDWFSNVVLHEDPQSTTLSKSNDEHITSLGTGLSRTLAQPVGAGIGSTGSASLYDKDSANDVIIENYYFFVAHESGWLGLAAFMALFMLIMTELWRGRRGWVALGVFASGAGLAIIGLLLPVWADETVALTWWALAGAACASLSGIIGGRHGRTARH